MIRPGRVAALLVLAGLTGAVAVVSAGDSNATPAAPPSEMLPVSAPVTADEPEPSATASITPESTTSASTDPGLDALAVVEGGLAAWGRFAVTGDLSVLEPWFDLDGPQYRQLAAEAEKLAAGALGPPPYSVVMSDAVVVEDGTDEVRMRGRVVFVRTGEASQSFDWEVVVRSTDGRFRIWTVNDR